MTLREFLAGLHRVKKSGEGWVTQCPAHDDHTQSLSVGEKDGRILVHCFAGCAAEAIVKARGCTLNDLFLDPRTSSTDTHERHIVATYDYHDEAGTLLYQVVRYHPKAFRQRRPDGTSGWVWSLGDVRRVVYRLHELAELRRVYLVEGEKDADALWALSAPATTTLGGAANWRDDFADQIKAAGIEEVIILPDNDDPGARYAVRAAAALMTKGLRVKILALPGLPPKGDVSDWLAQGHTHEALLAAVDAAPWTAATSDHGRSNGHGRPILVRLSDVEAEAVTWLWKDRVAVGKIALVIGNPGGGKTYLTSGDIAARVTRGMAWPDHGAAPQGAVILLTSEDGIADTLRPRMDKLGGDSTQTHVLRGVRHADDEDHPFNLENDLPALEDAVRDTKAVLVIIDPLSAYLGTKDSYKDAEIRGILSPLAQLAERLMIAVVGVLHLTKDQQRRLLMRAQGSIAFVAQARTVLAVGEDAEIADRRLFVGVKNNLGQTAATLAFTITDAGLTWETAPVEGTADELLAVDELGTRSDRRERDNATTFLRDMLKDGPISSKILQADAKENGIAQRTLWRAKDDLGVQADRAATQTGKAAWFWRLPMPGER